jgi:hypothetical protein
MSKINVVKETHSLFLQIPEDLIREDYSSLPDSYTDEESIDRLVDLYSNIDLKKQNPENKSKKIYRNLSEKEIDPLFPFKNDVSIFEDSLNFKWSVVTNDHVLQLYRIKGERAYCFVIYF